jgi:hypothetical protein
MNAPLENPFFPPFPQHAQTTSPSSPSRPAGQLLFSDVTEFYSWYVSCWYLSDGHYPSEEVTQRSETTRRILSLIKRIAEVSIQGGNFLSEIEEYHTIHALNNVFQDLNSGKLRKQNLPEALGEVLASIIEHNPKAKVVFQTTELEYRLCINPPADQPAELTAHYQKILAQIIQKITPQMRDINASAIAQGLSKILENHLGSKSIAEALNEAVKHWL